jgi:hypothetical protein
MGTAHATIHVTSTAEQSSCPPWCSADHARFDTPGKPQDHYSAMVAISPTPGEPGNRITVQALTSDHPLWRRGGVVSFGAFLPGVRHQGWPGIFLTPDDAGALAGLLDLLASAAPRQLRDLADGLRWSAALISEKGGLR